MLVYEILGHYFVFKKDKEYLTSFLETFLGSTTEQASIILMI
jgi:hypothetical protein